MCYFFGMVSKKLHSNKRKVRRYDRTEREKILKSFKSSDLSVREYSDRHDIRLSTLNHWLRMEKKTFKDSSIFYEAKFPSLFSGSDVEVFLAGGTRVRLSLSSQDQKEVLERFLRC